MIGATKIAQDSKTQAKERTYFKAEHLERFCRITSTYTVLRRGGQVAGFYRIEDEDSRVVISGLTASPSGRHRQTGNHENFFLKNTGGLSRFA